MEVEKRMPKGDRGFEEFKKKQSDLLNKKAGLQRELGRLEAQAEFLISQPKTGIEAAQAIRLLEEIKESLKNALKESILEQVRLALKDLMEKIERLLNSDIKDRESKIQELNGLKDKILVDLQEIDGGLEELRTSSRVLTKFLKNHLN